MQAQLAAVADINAHCLERVESGSDESIHPAAVHAVAVAVGCRIAAIPTTEAAAGLASERCSMGDVPPSRRPHAEYVRSLDDPDLATA